MKKLKKNENSKSWNTYYELAGSCACGICSCSCTSTSDASLTGMDLSLQERLFRTCILLYRSFEPNNRFDFWLLL